jgi:TonB-like protein
MRNQLLLSALSLVLWSLLGNAAESTVIFNHVSGARTQLDELVHEHFGKRYSVVDFTDREHTWVYPKGTWKPAPNPPFYVQNRCLSGSVLLLYIISADGSVTDPYVVKSTNPLLADAAIRRMTERRFQPGRLDGRFVSSVAATNVRFTCQESGINPGAL